MVTCLSATDLCFVVRRLPKDVQVLLRQNAGHVFLGGGFIRAVIAGEVPSDIDLFGSSDAVVTRAADALAAQRAGCRKHYTKNAITLLATERLPVQFIRRWTFDSAEALTASFDFTVCQAAIGVTEGAFVSTCSPDFYLDLAARRLSYTFPQREEEAGGSLLRVVKYLARGYRIAPESLAGVVSRLVGKVYEHPDYSRADEKWRARVLAGLLREVDPLTIVDGLEVMDEEIEKDDPS